RPREPFRRHAVHIGAARHIHLVAAADITPGIDNFGVHWKTSATSAGGLSSSPEPVTAPPPLSFSFTGPVAASRAASTPALRDSGSLWQTSFRQRSSVPATA